MNFNSFQANNSYALELDDSTFEYVAPGDQFPAFKSLNSDSVSPSSYSSDSSPTSNWNVEADDSGLEATSMSCCTSYPSSAYSSSTNINTTDGAMGTGMNSTSFTGSTNFALHQQLPHHSSPAQAMLPHQSAPQTMPQMQRPVFQRSNSLVSDYSSVSSFVSESSAGFRSHSSSFSNVQRPMFSQTDGRLGRSCVLPAPSLHQDETEATLFEFPAPNPIQVAQVSSRTGSSEASNAQQAELRILSQPARNHRARYRTEGSRGAIKDRMGRSFPVVKLYGYNGSAVKVRCFIGHDKKPGEAHLYYQVSRIVGKNITPCAISKVDGIKIVEFELSPDNDMQALVNCIGIVKERNFDVQRKSCTAKRKTCASVDQDEESLSFDKMGSSSLRPNQMAKRSTTCNLVFTAFVPGVQQPIRVISDTINCAQILGSPEVHKISAVQDAICGGAEIFVIGKNFTRDAKITWDFSAQHKLVTQLVMSESGHAVSIKSEKSRVKETDPETEFLHQNHLIFRVPPLKTLTHDYDGNQLFPSNHSFPPSDPAHKALVQVNLRIRCGEKYSEPIVFTFVDYSAQQRIQMSDQMSASFIYP